MKGTVQKQEEPPAISSPLPNSFFMFFVFLTGALVISFEVIFVRVLNLSLGAGIYNFPMILSIFVGALALGSLSIKKQRLSINFFTRQLLIILAFLQILFLTAPYWSIWFNHIRVSLVSLPSNYIIYYIVIFLLLLLFLFPVVFFMGRLLPLAYNFLQKTKSDYGKICGFLYFFNTLGTVFGAVVIGYLALYFLNLDILFKINIYILFLLTLAVIIYTKKKSDLVVLSILGLFLIYMPTQWNRTGHELGYFRETSYNPRMHFRKLFFLPKRSEKGREIGFFKDGPNTTVALINFNRHTEVNEDLFSNLGKLLSYDFKKVLSYSIVVNGKSDGNSLGDFSTVFFMLPYLYASNKENLKTAFVGLGTGISAGAYVPLKDVKSIDVLEISPFVIKAIKKVPPKLNFQVMNSKKVKIIETDAFRYFTRNRKKFDIIVSEPSNPWVVGVENLFTLEFYKLISKSLNKEGIFGQWLHTYDMDLSTLKIVIKTIGYVFPYASLYKVGRQDLLIVASPNELKNLSEKRFEYPFVKKFYKAMGLKNVQDLYLTQILSPYEFNQAAKLTEILPQKIVKKRSWFNNDKVKTTEIFSRSNSLVHPQLIYRTNKSMFLNTYTDPFELINRFHLKGQKQTEKIKAFNKYKNAEFKDWGKECLPAGGFVFLCQMMNSYSTKWRFFKDKDKPFFERFDSYIFLRKRGLIPYSQKMMDESFQKIVKQKNVDIDRLHNYVFEKIRRKAYEEADRDVLVFQKNDLINAWHYENFKIDLKAAKKIHKMLEAKTVLY